MKTKITILSIFFIQIVFSQTVQNQRINTGFNKNGSIEAHAATKGDREGSMYLYEEFSAIKVGGELQIFLARYNAFKDRMEFDDKGKTYEYYPNINDKEIYLINLDKTYTYLSYYIDENKSENGYLVKLQSGEKFTLYKKEQIKLREGRVSQTGYDKTMPDKFIQEKDAFFVKINEENIVKIPKSKKEFAKLFGDNETKVLNFLKEKDYSLKDESQLKVIFTYLNKNIQ